METGPTPLRGRGMSYICITKMRVKYRREIRNEEGTKHLRIAGTLEILLGVLSIVAIWNLLGSGQNVEGLSDPQLQDAFFGIVVGLYGANFFKILVGVIGICLANKKSKLTVALGALVFVAQLANFLTSGNGIVEIVLNIILLAIPYYYFHNALRNYRD